MARNAINNLQRSSLSSDDGKDQARIRVGLAYQADIPQMLSTIRDYRVKHEDEHEDSAQQILGTQIWQPTNNISAEEITNFMEKSYKKFGLSPEQSLGVLFLRGYNFQEAENDMDDFEPLETPLQSFDANDTCLFEIAYKNHSKSFHKIQEMLPHKKISELVNFYYLWKHKSKLKSYNTRQSGDSESNEDSNSNDADLGISELEIIDHEDINKVRDLLESKGVVSELRDLQLSVTSLKSSIQKSKQKIDLSKLHRQRKLFSKLQVEDIDVERLTQKSIISNNGIEVDFKPEEVVMLMKAIKDFGVDFEVITRIIPSKTPEMLEKFYNTKKKRFWTDGNPPTIDLNGVSSTNVLNLQDPPKKVSKKTRGGSLL